MSTAELKETAKKIVKSLFTDLNMFAELCTKEVVARHSYGPEYRGIDEIVDLLNNITADVRVVIDDCFGEGDRIAVRFRVFFSSDEYESVKNQISIIRFEGGKMAEWWGAYDRMSERKRRKTRP